MTTPDRPSSEAPSPEEWDLTTIPDDELEACTIYELGRESQIVREKAADYHRALCSEGTDGTATEFVEVLRGQYQVAFLLRELGRESEGLEKPWRAIPETVRKRAAEAVRIRKAFTGAGHEVESLKEALNAPEQTRTRRGVRSWDGVNLLFASGVEVCAVSIDWQQPVAKIREECMEWINEKIHNRPCIDGPDWPFRTSLLGVQRQPAKGRHSNPWAGLRDLLRGLSALRLLAKLPLKEAIALSTEHLSEAHGGPLSLYAGVIGHDGRPEGRSAWLKAAKKADAHFKKNIPTGEDATLSMQAYKRRRERPGK